MGLLTLFISGCACILSDYCGIIKVDSNRRYGMSTSSPVRRVHDVPIVIPIQVPKRLPEVSPERWIPINPIVVPERVPERVTVRQ